LSVFIGELLVIPEKAPAVIDCGRFFDNVTTEAEMTIINWYHDGHPLTNHSLPNVVLAADNKTVELVGTTTPAIISNAGNYTCEVCPIDQACNERTTVVDLCSKCAIRNVTEYYLFVLIAPPNFDKGIGTVSPVTPLVIMIKCGEDYETDTFVGSVIVQIKCPLFNGSNIMVTVY